MISRRDQLGALHAASFTTPDAWGTCSVEAGVALEPSAWVSLIRLAVAVVIEPVAELEGGKDEPLALRKGPAGAAPDAGGTRSDPCGLRCGRIALLREGRAVILLIRLAVAVVIEGIADLERRRGQAAALGETQFAVCNSSGALSRERGGARLTRVDDELVEGPVAVVIEPIATLVGTRIDLGVVVVAVGPLTARSSAITVVVFIDAKIRRDADPRAVPSGVQQEDARPSFLFASTVVRAKSRAKSFVKFHRDNAEPTGALSVGLTFLAETGLRAEGRVRGVDH
ncbi:MAG: hypothetical protein ACJAYU_001820 [Bradymonadia bacterium]